MTNEERWSSFFVEQHHLESIKHYYLHAQVDDFTSWCDTIRQIKKIEKNEKQYKTTSNTN